RPQDSSLRDHPMSAMAHYQQTNLWHCRPDTSARCALSVLVLGICARSFWKFPVECLPILDTATQKLRPVRNIDMLRNRLRKETTKLWMMPTQIVPTTVTVSTDAAPQPHHLIN